jgi:hypothetical protein
MLSPGYFFWRVLDPPKICAVWQREADHRGILQSQAEPNYRCAAMMSGVSRPFFKKKQIVCGEALFDQFAK